jgi:hypothetical protein
MRGDTKSGLEVRWAATDPDGDALFATIDFSPDDGRTWTTVFQGPSTGSAQIPGRALAASRRARIRVGVNDGFNEPRALSGVFRADGTPPAIRIARPALREPLRAGARTQLVGSALDDRRQALPARSLTWYAGHNRLGSGNRLTARLPAGQYALRLVARDRDGRTAVARLQVSVQRTPMQLVSIGYKRTVERHARTLDVRIATSEPAILRAAGRRYRVGPRTRRVVLLLPRRPKSGVLRIPCKLVAPGDRRLTGTVKVRRR